MKNLENWGITFICYNEKDEKYRLFMHEKKLGLITPECDH